MPRRYALSIVAALAGCHSAEPPRAADAPEDAPGEPIPTPQADPSHESRYAGEKLPDGSPAFAGAAHEARAGKTTLRYTRVYPTRDPRPCPFESPSPEACGLLTVGGKTRAAPFDWGSIEAGRNRFWARRLDPTRLDVVTDTGEVVPTAIVAPLSNARHALVVDTETSTYVVGMGPHGTWVRPLADGALGRGRQLAITVALTAGEAREAREGGGRAAYGPPAAVALSGERWAFVWVEAIPPPRGTPRGAKNGCGKGLPRGPSRELADPSVEKHVTVTRFEGSTLVDEERVLRDDRYHPRDRALVVREEGGAVRVSLDRRP